MKKDNCKNVEGNNKNNNFDDKSKKTGKKRIILYGLLAVGIVAVPPIAVYLFKRFDRWCNAYEYARLEEGERLSKMSKDELDELYEEKRLVWASQGGGDRTPEMERINEEINKRTAEEWMNNPLRNPDFHWTDANRWEKD